MLLFELITNPTDLPNDTASRMTRAKQMGFDISRRLFHGTGASFDSFKKKFGGTSADIGKGFTSFAVWLTTSGDVAGEYAQTASTDQTAWDGSIIPRSGNANVMPLFVRLKDFMTVDCSELNHYHLLRNKSSYLGSAQYRGYKGGVIFKNAEDGTAHRSDIYAVFQPNLLRSIFAQFDPAKARSSNLMA